MLSAIACANDAIRQEAARNAEYQHMGTTLVCAVARSDMAIIGNIGDSRAYHITPEGIFQISRDHSVVENMVAKGDLTPLEARTHPNRNLITRRWARTSTPRRTLSNCPGTRTSSCCSVPTDW